MCGDRNINSELQLPTRYIQYIQYSMLHISDTIMMNH